MVGGCRLKFPASDRDAHPTVGCWGQRFTFMGPFVPSLGSADQNEMGFQQPSPGTNQARSFDSMARENSDDYMSDRTFDPHFCATRT